MFGYFLIAPTALISDLEQEMHRCQASSLNYTAAAGSADMQLFFLYVFMDHLECVLKSTFTVWTRVLQLYHKFYSE